MAKPRPARPTRDHSQRYRYDSAATAVSHGQREQTAKCPGGAYWQGGETRRSAIRNHATGSSSLPLAPASPAMPATPNHNFASLPGANGASGMVANPHYSSAPSPPVHKPRCRNGQAITSAQRPNGPCLASWLLAVTRLLAIKKLKPVCPRSSIAEHQNIQRHRLSPGLCGYCPVACAAKNHNGSRAPRSLRSAIAVASTSGRRSCRPKVLSAPTKYTPISLAIDPLIYLRDGQLVEGSIYDGVLKDRQYLLLFSCEANKQYFHDNYDRLISELEAVIRQQVSSK